MHGQQNIKTIFSFEITRRHQHLPGLFF